MNLKNPSVIVCNLHSYLFNRYIDKKTLLDGSLFIILDSGESLEVCETLFMIIDFKGCACIRRLKYSNAIETANNRANQLYTIIGPG